MIKKIMIKKMKLKLIKILQMINLNKREINYSQSFSLPIILSYLDINIPDNASTLTKYSFSVFFIKFNSFTLFH